MRHEPRKTQRQAPKPKPRRPDAQALAARASLPIASPQMSNNKAPPKATQAAKERPTKEPSLPANSTPNRRDPAYTPAHTPRQPPCPEPRKPLILRHADPPNGKLQPLCPAPN